MSMIDQVKAEFPGCLVMEESDFHSRCQKNLPVRILKKFWVEGSLMIAFDHSNVTTAITAGDVCWLEENDALGTQVMVTVVNIYPSGNVWVDDHGKKRQCDLKYLKKVD